MYGRQARYPALPPPGAVHYRQRGDRAALIALASTRKGTFDAQHDLLRR